MSYNFKHFNTFMPLFLKILSGMAKSVDPDQTALFVYTEDLT